jgi:Ribbon-helix-helix protein, copG family
MKQRKTQIIKARVSTNMKRGIDDLAQQRGESEAVIVREALSEYLKKSAMVLNSGASPNRKKRNQSHSRTISNGPLVDSHFNTR